MKVFTTGQVAKICKVAPSPSASGSIRDVCGVIGFPVRKTGVSEGVFNQVPQGARYALGRLGRRGHGQGADVARTRS